MLFSLLILTSAILACSWNFGPEVPELSAILDTPTVVHLPSITPILRSTPAPTMIPLVKIEDADQALFNGDWEMALLEYSTVYERFKGADGESENASAALLGLGRTQLNMGHYEAALETLNLFVVNYPGASQQASAHFVSAQAYEALSNYVEAAESYNQYLENRPGLIDSYVLEWRGDALAAAGNHQTAIDDYQSSMAAPRLDSTLPIELKIANSYAALGDYDTALLAYQDIYTRSNNEYTKANVDIKIGNIYLDLGLTDEAYGYYFDAIENYPLSFDSYQALVYLVESGYPVNDFNRGLVDYFAGQYSLAIAAFDRYLNTSAEHAGTAYYYRGLAFRALDDPVSAVASWEILIQSYLASEFWDDAWEEKAYTLWAYLDQYSAAAETMLEFVEDYPTHTRAAEFLFDAAQISERNRELKNAAEIWERIPPEYPSSAYSPRAIFLAGISYYRVEEFDLALAAFEWLLNSSADPGTKASAYFWMAKSFYALGSDDNADLFFNNAANADPTGYYSERARDQLMGLVEFQPPVMFDLAFDLSTERENAETWMHSVFAIPEAINLSHLGELVNDMRVVRGTELWNLGLYEMARLEFEALRADIKLSPIDNYRLANYLLDLGLYRTAIFSARQVLDINDMGDAETLTAPNLFNHLRFGSYYKELILPAGDNYGFHPLFLFSILRQESLFEGFVRSSAGAQGLMQIMPATAQDIISKGVWPPGYDVDSLYRPVVNIELGVDYLDSLLQYFNGDIYAALAAYNAGPGNAQIWYNLAGGDQDLFLEVIRFEETRNYIKGIYEVFSIYRRLYDRSP